MEIEEQLRSAETDIALLKTRIARAESRAEEVAAENGALRAELGQAAEVIRGLASLYSRQHSVGFSVRSQWTFAPEEGGWWIAGEEDRS